MTTSVQDLSVPNHWTSTWSEVECRTRFCQRCQRVPFDEGAFHGRDGIVAVSETGDGILQLHPDEPDALNQNSLEVDFELVDIWPQLPILTKSAKDCDFCNLLKTRLRKTEIPSGFHNAWIRVELFYCWWNQEEECGLAGLKARVCGKLEPQHEFTGLVWLVFTIDAEKGECKRWLRLQQRPPAEFLSGENISKITARLERLDNSRTSNFLPTRLIDLGCHDKSSTSGRLVTKEEAYSEHYTSPLYVALSYPWGSPEQAARQSKTTRENICDRTTSINLKTVSQVIQDAATVCKLLGVRYLWVDALCIIQGDLQDWERESTTMGNIFRNAYLTIGAAAIESCHESFLSQEVDALEIPFVSRTKPSVTGIYRLVARKNEDAKVRCWVESSYLTDMEGPWETRGWVFQEIAMSTRLLLFGRTSMVLETLEEGCEMLPSWFNLFRQRIDYLSWTDLVTGYSGMNLTFKKDTFPAISGLAGIFAEHLNDQYLAGIWKNDISIQLFWYSRPSPYVEIQSFCELVNTMSSRPYIAPSWSWAAKKEYTQFGSGGFYLALHKRQLTPKCRVLDAECIVEGLDPFGVVQSGYIALSAKVLRLEQKKLSATPTPDENVGNYDWYLNGEARVLQTFLDGRLERNDPEIHRVVFVLLGSYNEIGINSEKNFRFEEAPDGENCAYGLVLYPAQGTNTFYRVGLFYSEPRKHAPDGGLKFCNNWKTEKVTII